VTVPSVRAAGVLVFALGLSAGCAPNNDRSTSAEDHGAQGIARNGPAMETGEAHHAFGDSALAAAAVALRLSTAAREPGTLSTVASAPVIGWLGPDSAPFNVALRTQEQRAGHTRRFGTITLATTLRGKNAPDLGSYPCTSCHFGRRVDMKDQRIGDAHQNIKPVHPAQVGAVCSTCHASDNVERLALRSGERPTLDHAYRLCAQCHVQQVRAWAAGAHGKRLDAWQGRRVVMGCADCHNPHHPATEPRTPFRAPQLERTRDRRHD
jgi:hypothetical protein